MLTAQQQAFVQALEELDLQQVQRLLTDGLSLNFIDPEKGPVISVWSDGLFKWWEAICEAYEAGAPLSEQEKQQTLAVHLDILEQLIHGKANLHLWDTEGIQPSIIKDIGRVIRKLADGGDMAVVLVEQFYDFAEELADAYTVMARGQVIAQGAGCEMPAKGIRELVAI
jgi:hypothetical protein